ncbi:MAG: hypothetical protein Q7N50_08740 [Armatimonadota bacterium]|nr:hypothetical protein [Armatimonadota bacterium]
MRNPSILAAILALSLISTIAQAGQPGDFNAAAYGSPSVVGANGSVAYAPKAIDGSTSTAIDVKAGESVQIEWRQPRDIYQVRLVFAGPAPNPKDVQLQWWYRIWPDNGTGGWLKLDDPFNGEFVNAAATAAKPNENTLEFRIKPLDKAEVPNAKNLGADYRRTYKLGAVLKAPAHIAEFECYTDSKWQKGQVAVDLIGKDIKCGFEGRNAVVTTTDIFRGADAVLNLRFASNPDRLSPDRGYVIVRQNGKGPDFSFFVDDVVENGEGSIYVRDVNALIFNALRADLFTPSKRPVDSWDATIMEKVAAMPEQSFDRAMKEIPRKWIDQVHLGLPGLRQEVSLDAQSCIFTHSKSLRGIGVDAPRSPKFPGEWSMRRYIMVTHKSGVGAPSPKRIKRWLEDGYMPVVHSVWLDESMSFHQTTYATALDPVVLKKSMALPKPPPAPMGKGKHAADFGLGVKGDEPLAAMSKLLIKNLGKSEETAYIFLKPSPMAAMKIDANGMLILDAPTKPSAGEGLTPAWGQIDIRGKGELDYIKDFVHEGGRPADARAVIRYTVRLAPSESHAIVLKVPYIEQMTGQEISQMKALDWDKSYREVSSLWKKRLAKAIEQYKVPEKMITNLYRTNLWHVLITTDRDPSTGLYEHGAGTYSYPMYANEAMMVARSLEMRGEHEEARRIFEPCIVSQGAKALPGNFKSKDGLLYAAAPPEFDHYTAQGYNMHHGFILWAAAEHYFWTRDRKYLETVAPNLVAACDWITRERQATMVMNPDGTKPLEYGLAPAGDLEDVEEYLYFYPTNGYYYLGMKTAADALAEIGNPQAARIAADAKAYAEDIMTSLREATATCPVVKLLDGSYIPFVPDRAYVLTDRNEGWIREALYSTLHLVNCGLIAPDDHLTTWLLQDLEDRIFLSEESGPGSGRIKDLKAQFFSLGGFNPQPNLLDNSIAYLKRGQIPNFVRAFFNIFSASIYPDTICFSEVVPPFADGASSPDEAGPLYKTPDESKFIQFMRQMLVLEMGSDLYIGRGVPKAWMADGKSVVLRDAATYFGPMSVKITSFAAKDVISAWISLPARNPAKVAKLILRHPDGKELKAVTVNGRPWKDFDPASETVTLPGGMGKVQVVASY